MDDITGACATNGSNPFEPVEGFEPPMRLPILITSQVQSASMRHWRSLVGQKYATRRSRPTRACYALLAFLASIMQAKTTK